MTIEYTIEQLIEDFEEAQTPDAKQSLIDSIDESLIAEHADIIKELKNQIGDLKDQLAEEEDAKINIEIEKGDWQLYTCAESIDEYAQGRSYYVQILDIKSEYIKSFGGDMPEAIKEYISNIKPLVWIVNDNGIGTLKYKKVVNFNFEEYFSK